MNLKEAPKRGKLKQFAKVHGNKDPHPMGKERFEALCWDARRVSWSINPAGASRPANLELQLDSGVDARLRGHDGSAEQIDRARPQAMAVLLLHADVGAGVAVRAHLDFAPQGHARLAHDLG
jgi:hypothetical protein